MMRSTPEHGTDLGKPVWLPPPLAGEGWGGGTPR
jgi:hypothetical protein